MSEIDHVSRGQVERRSFLVTMAGTLLGKFVLPSFGISSLVDLARDDESSELDDAAVDAMDPSLCRNVLRKADKFDLPDEDGDSGRFGLIWVEDCDGRPTTMAWAPSPENRADALKFYVATRNCYPRDPELDVPPSRVEEIRRRRRPAAELQLCRRIAERPDDVKPRLAYANYLKQCGDAQGEFIEASCELQRCPVDDPRFDQLSQRVLDLEARHVKQWFLPLACLGLRPMVHQQFFPAKWLVDGVIGKITIYRPDVLPEHAEELFHAAPALFDLTLDFDDLDVVGICGCAELSQIRRLGWSNVRISGEGIRALVESPHLRHLQHLMIRACDLGIDDLQTLDSWRGLSALSSLDLSVNNMIPDSAFAQLLAPSRVSKLQSLNLGHTQVADETLRQLATWPRPLRSLNIRRTKPDAAALGSLLQSAAGAGLEELNLAACDLDDSAIADAVKSARCLRLRSLDLSDNRIGAEGAEALGALPLDSLEELDLTGNPLGNAGIKELLKTPKPSLRTLRLAASQIDDEGLLILSQCQWFSQLDTLILDGNPIGRGGAKSLAVSRSLPRLRELGLRDCAIGDEGALDLFHSTLLGKLRMVDMTGISPEVQEKIGQRFWG